MAATAIALTKIPLNGGVELPATAALDGTAGAEIQFDGQDTKIVILIENGGSSAGDVTFKAGNGIQGVADLVVNVANGKTKAVVLESGAFKKAGKVTFNVKLVFTFLILQYSIAFFRPLLSKLLAEALALNELAPKYMLSAPF